MNNIYKVICSKAKNCYVVASEIARSHTKSATGSKKIGGVTRRSLLASLMALSLLCGGLGVASATLEVVNQNGTAGTTTIYTKEEVDNALTAKGAATDVATNKADIANLKTAVGDAGSGLTKAVADQKADIATNRANINNLDGKLANLTTTVNGKADEADVNNKLAQKADVTALEAKADRTYVDQKLTEAGTNVDNKLADYYNKAAVDGKIVDEAIARDTAITKAIEQERNDRDAAITTAINREVTDRGQAIHDAIELEKTNRDAAVANAKAELQGKIDKNSQDITTLDGKIKTNADNIQTNADNIKNNKDEIARVNG